MTYASDNLQLDTEHLSQKNVQTSLTDLHDLPLFTWESPYANCQIYKKSYQDLKGDIFMFKKTKVQKPYHSLFQHKSQYLNQQIPLSYFIYNENISDI